MSSDIIRTMPEPLHPSPVKVRVLAAAMTVLAAIVYCSRLDVAPVYLTKDEASYGIQAHAIATSGRDINGRRLPLFFQESGFSIGRDPIYIYASAAVLKFVPLSEGALRIPTTLAAAISVGLVVLIAYELYGSISVAAVAGLLLACTPVFFIRSRAALSVILPVPFQLIWLLLMVRYGRSGRLRQLLGATAALGVGMYSYLSMLFFVPFHMLFTVAEALRQRRWRHAGLAIATLIILLVPLAWWQATHPGRVGDIASSYRIYPPELTPLQGVKDVLSWSSLSRRSDIYWNAFNPSKLFFAGESGPVDSTRSAGLLPVVYLVLLPLGLYHYLTKAVTLPRLAIVALIIIGPVPGVLVGEDTIGRYLVAAPATALLAAGVLQSLWRSRYWLLKAAAVGAVALSIYLFGGFYRHYMTDWRIDSAPYFGGNIKGAMETVLTSTPAPAGLVLLSERIPYVSTYWEFYRRKHNRADLVGRDRGLRATDSEWQTAPPGSFAIVRAREDPSREALQAAGWVVVADIYEFYGGPPTFVVLARS